MASSTSEEISAGYIAAEPLNLHARLSEISSSFHNLQDEVIAAAKPEQAEHLRQIAVGLIELCEYKFDQVVGELFLSEYWDYNYTKPLYIAASLIELIRRYRDYGVESPLDDSKREQLVLAALGFNLGLLEYEKQVYENQEDFSFEEKLKLREHYPQQSAEILKRAGLDLPVILDVVRNHNIASDNPSKDALLLRTPFVYAGIALPYNSEMAKQSINNPSKEFARMYANQELDPVYGGLFLKINGMAPIGSIINLESCEKVVVVKGPDDEDISSSQVRMLTNNDGVQLIRPGETYRFDQMPSRHRRLADHHQFAWTHFSPAQMWKD